MLNPIVIPIMPILGIITANINELIRGESSARLPQLQLGVKTFNAAVAAFSIVWFALLITAIDVSNANSVIAGIEVMGLFLAGIAIYTISNGGKYFGATTQLWVYRLALPLVLSGSFLVGQFG
ncbi:hypothetical protein TUM4438_19940 [Shewanella sairae]|uniref:DUF1304 domain-containing protein n=1 Tax=Shewanella sairae TaxID=190310 RepID=A0ABQ4PEA0_9GAMM|nr:hypothetical protein [Shewanella sairae]MCL1129103.1 hypothetical protein [Shewanella sairae]GIU45748.1 hypothetical protein TUM4438_19940 [Shewanella sairae]